MNANHQCPLEYLLHNQIHKPHKERGDQGELIRMKFGNLNRSCLKSETKKDAEFRNQLTDPPTGEEPAKQAARHSPGGGGNMQGVWFGLGPVHLHCACNRQENTNKKRKKETPVVINSESVSKFTVLK